MDFWVTKNGRKMPVETMSDSHLLNAQRSVRDRLTSLGNFQHNSSVFAPSEDTIAYDDFEEALESSYKKESALFRVANMLNDEIRRRNLQPIKPRAKVERIKIKTSRR